MLNVQLVLLLLVTCVTVALACRGIRWFAMEQRLFLDAEDAAKPQRMHTCTTPRVGGIAIYLATAGFFFLPYGSEIFLAALPTFFIGAYEDLRANVSPKVRLLVMLVSALAVVFVLDVKVTDYGFFELPEMFAAIFTLFAILGVTNSFNIIDGLNGLAAGSALLTIALIGWVAYGTGDAELASVAWLASASTLGFLFINYPKGAIFLGDAGAYSLGFFSAVFSLVLVQRHPEISPWFPLVLVIYPVWEVVFSMIRRKFVKKVSVMSADREHLHSLLFLVLLRSNPVASLAILLAQVLIHGIGYIFRANHVALLTLTLLFMAGYTVAYVLLHRAYVRMQDNVPLARPVVITASSAHEEHLRECSQGTVPHYGSSVPRGK